MTDTRAAFEAWYLSITETSYRADLWHAWQAATKLERSECAKVCEKLSESLGKAPGSLYSLGTVDGADGAAAAIRGRSQP